MSCAVSSKRAPLTASHSIPATTITSCSTCWCRLIIKTGGQTTTVRIKGGLLGHWSVWVKKAVELLERLHAASGADTLPVDLLTLDSQVTDCNAAIFDVANDFHGVIAGCHEILRRQGLLEGIWCLDPNETLGPGQKQEIDRILCAPIRISMTTTLCGKTAKDGLHDVAGPYRAMRVFRVPRSMP